MGRRSDARQRMVLAARQLFRQQGYHATALSDVLELSAAPRGSVYFHFPNGKAQLAIEAAELHARELVEFIDQSAQESGSAAGLMRAYVGLARDNLVNSDYKNGCVLAPLVIEAARDADELGDVGRRAFSFIIESLATHFTAFGLDAASAHTLADAVVAGVEGALVTARALRSPTPFESVLAALENQLAAVTPAASSAPIAS
jgi:TetR/AcrR family transcriptional repressor of lmrAB and yxaGH operons